MIIRVTAIFKQIVVIFSHNFSLCTYVTTFVVFRDLLKTRIFTTVLSNLIIVGIRVLLLLILSFFNKILLKHRTFGMNELYS